MLYIYDKQKKTLESCQETEFKNHGLLERYDLQKWIEQNPDILGEEIFIITSEYDRFDKTNERLDLLGLDKDGNLVVIELKRDDSGKNVDLQALKYAAYCSTLCFDDLVDMYVNYKRNINPAISRDSAEAEIDEFIENQYCPIIS